MENGIFIIIDQTHGIVNFEFWNNRFRIFRIVIAGFLELALRVTVPVVPMTFLSRSETFLVHPRLYEIDGFLYTI